MYAPSQKWTELVGGMSVTDPSQFCVHSQRKGSKSLVRTNPNMSCAANTALVSSLIVKCASTLSFLLGTLDLLQTVIKNKIQTKAKTKEKQKRPSKFDLHDRESDESILTPINGTQ